MLHHAYADESFREDALLGFYVLAAAVVEPHMCEEVREAMLALRGRRATKKLHWNEMDRLQQQEAAKMVAALRGFHVVTVGAPLPHKRQERARAACLTALIVELSGLGIEDLVMEGRTSALNQRDIRTAVGARFALPKGAHFRLEHRPGADEPIFWAADIVAGAVRAARQDMTTCREILADCVYEIEVSTGC